MLQNASSTTFTVPELLRENQQGAGWGVLKLPSHKIMVNKLWYFYLVSHKFLHKILDIMNLQFSLLYVTWLSFNSYVIFIEAATGCQFFLAVLFHHYFVVNIHKRYLLLLKCLILCLQKYKSWTKS